MLNPNAIAAVQIHLSFPGGEHATEEILLRWIHFLAGITWIGLLYYFNLVTLPLASRLDEGTRLRLTAQLMPRAFAWFRWSALITVLAGLRYFILILEDDAHNTGHPGLAWSWLWHWLVVWIVAYAVIHALMQPTSGLLSRGPVRALLIAVVVIAASWAILAWNADPNASNGALAIAVGGGIGLVMLFILWGFVWRAQKRLIAWAQAAIERHQPVPAEAARLAQWVRTGAHVGFWLSLPMLFFMAAADHYPFLSPLVR